MEEFYTIAEDAQITAEVVEKKSKFIANIFYINRKHMTLNYIFFFII